jgi:hypothetical protein
MKIAQTLRRARAKDRFYLAAASLLFALGDSLTTFICVFGCREKLITKMSLFHQFVWSTTMTMIVILPFD